MNKCWKSIHISFSSVKEKVPEMARKRVMKGGFFSSIYKKFNKERVADCKDWLKRQQKKRKMKGGSKKRKNNLRRKKRTGKKR